MNCYSCYFYTFMVQGYPCKLHRYPLLFILFFVLFCFVLLFVCFFAPFLAFSRAIRPTRRACCARQSRGGRFFCNFYRPQPRFNIRIINEEWGRGYNNISPRHCIWVFRVIYLMSVLALKGFNDWLQYICLLVRF